MVVHPQGEITGQTGKHRMALRSSVGSPSTSASPVISPVKSACGNRSQKLLTRYPGNAGWYWSGLPGGSAAIIHTTSLSQLYRLTIQSSRRN